MVPSGSRLDACQGTPWAGEADGLEPCLDARPSPRVGRAHPQAPAQHDRAYRAATQRDGTVLRAADTAGAVGREGGAEVRWRRWLVVLRDAGAGTCGSPAPSTPSRRRLGGALCPGCAAVGSGLGLAVAQAVHRTRAAATAAARTACREGALLFGMYRRSKATSEVPACTSLRIVDASLLRRDAGGDGRKGDAAGPQLAERVAPAAI